jgi:glycosyltransferase involved in cell wall biosynthesis
MRGIESQIAVDRWKGPQFAWALHRCAGIVCVSQSLRELALAQGVPDEKICVIPNAVNRTLFHPADKQQARQALGVGLEDQLVVSVAMLVHGKGHHLLVRAIAELCRKNPRLRLAIIGGRAHEPGYPAYLKKLVSDLNLNEVVHVAGPQSPETVATWLSAADLFALPTYDEGCCNAILEAMACGLPVISTPVGDNAALIDPPRRGLLVPTDNAEELAAALARGLAMPWDRPSIAQYGSDYTWQEVARQTSAFFKHRLEMAGLSTPASTSPAAL